MNLDYYDISGMINKHVRRAKYKSTPMFIKELAQHFYIKDYKFSISEMDKFIKRCMKK